MGRARDKSLRLSVANIAHKSTRASSAVNLESRTKDHVAKKQSRSPASLYRLWNVCAEVAEQIQKRLFLIDLSGVVGGPILRIGNANGGGLFNRRAIAVGSGFTEEDVLHSVHMFAGFLSFFEIEAGAVLAFLGDGHGITALGGLRRNDPGPRIPFGNFRAAITSPRCSRASISMFVSPLIDIY
jgi:hypothetical protein